jgi:hypothetical protein
LTHFYLIFCFYLIFRPQTSLHWQLLNSQTLKLISAVLVYMVRLEYFLCLLYVMFLVAALPSDELWLACSWQRIAGLKSCLVHSLKISSSGSAS